MTRLAAVALLGTLAVGCTAAEDRKALETSGSGDLVVIEGAPQEGKTVARAGATLEAEPVALGTLGGVVAIGTEDGTWATSLGADSIEPLAVHPDQDGPKSTGKVRQLARRAPDGVLVLAEAGLFHSAAGYLLSSPFADSVDPASIVQLSSFGSGDAEELWIVTDERALWATGGKLTEFSLDAAPGAITLAIGMAPGRAVVAAAGSAYLADLAAGSAVELAPALGTIHGGAAEEDGSVHLASDAGLLSLTRSGELELRTFAEAGAPANAVLSVASAFGAVHALTTQGLVVVEADGATRLSSVAPSSAALALDANGDTWALEDGALFRYETGAPVSFETHVLPFFVAHCQSCHDAGAGPAPDHDFTAYETAKEFSDSIARRLQATDATTMPPPNEEVLTAADYAVVLRWVSSGMLP